MEKNRKLNRLEEHLEALENAYSKMIVLLSKDMDTKGEDDDMLSLKDSQIDSFAKGILKASEAANSLLLQIEEKEDAIRKLKNPEKHKEQVESKKEESDDKSDLNNRLA